MRIINHLTRTFPLINFYFARYIWINTIWYEFDNGSKIAFAWVNKLAGDYFAKTCHFVFQNIITFQFSQIAHKINRIALNGRKFIKTLFIEPSNDISFLCSFINFTQYSPSMNCYQRGSCFRDPDAFNAPTWATRFATHILLIHSLFIYFVKQVKRYAA